MMKIRQGTTDTINIRIPDSIDLTAITEAWLYIDFGGTLKLDKTLEDMVVEAEAKRIFCPLTQAETLALPAEQTGYIQLRMLDDNGIAYTSDPQVPVFVEKAYKGGVIT